VQRILLAFLALVVPHPLWADEHSAAAPKKADAFFAGTVVESTAEMITLTRTVLGKAEDRSFVVTPDTKIEGRLRARVRVTVRYISDENGDTATMIIVRSTKKK
jgi:hypothetical protein